MRATFLLTFVVLVLSKDLDFSAQMDKLESTKFGHTLVDTIYMQLQSEDPVSNLIEMMQSLQNQFEAEQEKEDDKNERTQYNCDADLLELGQIIGQTTVVAQGLKSELDGLIPQKTSSIQALNRKAIEIEDLRGELAEQTEKRDAQKDRYTETLDQLEQSLFGVNQIKNFFNQFLDVLGKNRRQFDRSEPQSDDSFLQESSSVSDDEENDQNDDDLNFVQIQTQMNKVKHQMKQEGYKSLVQILISMSTDIQNASIDKEPQSELLTKKVISILKSIEGFIQDQRLYEDQAEVARASLFSELELMYTDQTTQAQADKVAMEGLIDSLSAQIQSAQNEKFEVDQKLDVKKREQEDRETDCFDSKTAFETENVKRASEKADLAQALELITSKLGQIKSRLLENIDN